MDLMEYLEALEAGDPEAVREGLKCFAGCVLFWVTVWFLLVTL